MCYQNLFVWFNYRVIIINIFQSHEFKYNLKSDFINGNIITHVNFKKKKWCYKLVQILINKNFNSWPKKKLFWTTYSDEKFVAISVLKKFDF